MAPLFQKSGPFELAAPERRAGVMSRVAARVQLDRPAA
ncbi:hypothetical protein BSLA_03f1432 [Burkholderia stabilis]|nr:hypothetical protein BSLA_03f1432 [Burkholderia stabilis]